MTSLIAALQMYDWPEVRADTDAQWASMRDRLRVAGIAAPEVLTRDMDMHDVWLQPNLLIAQTCWGPMELGLQEKVQVVGQPNYDGIDGGQGIFYSSAIVMKRGAPGAAPSNPRRQGDGKALIPLDLIRGRRFAFNDAKSMSGLWAITHDLTALGESLDIFSERIESGAHRTSIAMVADGRADVATIDCRSWELAKRFEPTARDVEVVGWTALRKGLPFITAKTMPAGTVARMREALELR